MIDFLRSVCYLKIFLGKDSAFIRASDNSESSYMDINTDNNLNFKDFNNADAWIDLQQDEYEQLIGVAKKMIEIGLEITGNKKTNVCKQGSRFYECLKKYMTERKWGLSDSSIKSYLQGKFGKNSRYQFLDYLNGVKEFFYLEDISSLFLADEEQFKKKILDAKRKSEKIPEKVISFSDKDILKSVLNQTLCSGTFRLSYLVTFLFCFVGTALFCYFSGTLIGNDPARKYFLHDMSSLMNYLVICPSYVGLSIIIMNNYIILSNIRKLRAIEISIWICALILIVLSLSINYNREILNPNTHTKIYWYIGHYIKHISEETELKLGIIGIYYVFLNFILQFFIINPIFVFINLILLFLRFSRELNKYDADAIGNNLHAFACEYILLKLLVITYIGNMYTWKISNPQNSINFIVLLLLLSIIGVGIVPATRCYVKMNLYNLIKKGVISIDDVYPSAFSEISYFLDVIILLTFIKIFWL